MNINRNNYEEYFLLYVDNELSAVEREAVEVFVNDNADLRGELNLLQQLVVRADKKITFNNKAELMKNSAPANPVNETNYEEYFLLYGDDELTNEEKDFVEQFVYRHPLHQSAFELLQGIRFTADTSVMFPDKQSLYRSEKDERVIVMRWWRIAAAAVVLLFLGGAALYFSGTTTKPDELVKGEPKIDTTANRKKISPNTVTNDNNIAQSIEPVTNAQETVSPVTENKAEQQKRNLVKNKEQQQPLVAVNTTDQKKSIPPSNTFEDPNVKLKEATALVENPIKEIDKVTGSETKAVIINQVESFEKQSEEHPESVVPASFASNNSQIKVLNTTVSNKSKMRGFFRKVGRVVDKATNIGPTDESEDKKGIRIASFQIALK